jgi:hypothetical protein
METTLNERIRQIIFSFGFKKDVDFANHCKISAQSLSNATSGNTTDPQFSFLRKILVAVPELNARWLLTGEGQLLTSVTYPEQKGEGMLANESNSRYMSQVEKLKMENEHLLKTLSDKEKLIETKDKLISALEAGSQ